MFPCRFDAAQLTFDELSALRFAVILLGALRARFTRRDFPLELLTSTTMLRSQSLKTYASQQALGINTNYNNYIIYDV